MAAVSASANAAPKPRIVFPVLGPVTYTDDFGDPRAGGTHEGNDIMAPRKALALAAESGTVQFWTTSANAGCMLYLHGDSGTTYLYIHLNNDLGTGNDNKGSCVPGTAYAPDLVDGARVEAGQPVGFVGDSGDANGIHPHLHFEVHPKKAAVDPFPYLKKAQRLLFWEPDERVFTLVLDGKVTAVGDGTLTLAVDTLKEWPSHQKVVKLGRTLTVTMPLTASQIAATAVSATVPDPAVGDKVRVWTAPAPASTDTRTGVDGAISVAKLLVR
ncbi:MAG TPA: M23 family metallopeptidase [Gaiellaceae bacterium]